MNSEVSLGHGTKLLSAIKALRENDVLVQVNTTLTQQNYNQIDDIMSLVGRYRCRKLPPVLPGANGQRRKNS